MIKTTLIAATALTMSSFAVAPAKADGFFFGFYGNNGGIGIHSGGYHPRYVAPRPVVRVLSRQQIRRSLRHRGYSDFQRIERRGNRYIVVAESRRGRLVRLRVNAYTAEIESRRRIR